MQVVSHGDDVARQNLGCLTGREGEARKSGWQRVRAVQGTAGPDPGWGGAQAGPGELRARLPTPSRGQQLLSSLVR